jgi:hypothetical protein
MNNAHDSFITIKNQITTMKDLNKTTVILKALDLELKALLLADIRNFKAACTGQKQLQAKQAA